MTFDYNFPDSLIGVSAEEHESLFLFHQNYKAVCVGSTASCTADGKPFTVVPHIAIAPYSDEIALRWTFCHCKSDRFAMVPMGKIRFAMIAGKRSSQSPHFCTADRRFQNGRRKNKMAAHCFALL